MVALAFHPEALPESQQSGEGLILKRRRWVGGETEAAGTHRAEHGEETAMQSGPEIRVGLPGSLC